MKETLKKIFAIKQELSSPSLSLKGWFNAAKDGDVKTMQDYINKGFDKDTKAIHDHEHALHYAVIWDHPDVIKLLHANGANMNATDKDNESALHYSRDPKTTQLLVDLGVDTSIVSKSRNPDRHQDMYGKTALEKHIAEGNTEAAKVLQAVRPRALTGVPAIESPS